LAEERQIEREWEETKNVRREMEEETKRIQREIERAALFRRLEEGISAAIASVALRHAPFELRFAGAGAFGGKRPRVLWAGVAGPVDALAAAQRDVVSALSPLGFPPEDRPYSAHLTLARARDPRGDPALAACAAALARDDFGPTRVEAIMLYRSELSPKGPTYTAVATLPLG